MLASVIGFIQAHEAVLVAAGVAVIDLVMALIPSMASNGILHWVYVQLVGLEKPPAPPAA